ncbi:MAG TPA: DUF481 domain-containing protein [Noviherbaspirillum sp.]
MPVSVLLSRYSRLAPRLFFLTAFLFACHAHAATVTLANGDRVSGQQLRLSGEVLTLDSPLFGEVKIPWKHVLTVSSDDEVRVRLSDGSRAKGRIALDENGQLRIEREGSAAQVVARNQIAALNPPVIDPSYKVAGRVDVGGSFNRGNSRDEQLNLNGQVTARSPADRYTVDFEANEARSTGLTTTSNRRLRAQYDAFLNERDYLFANAELARDQVAGLKLRSALGAGLGREFYESELTRLAAQAGLSYVREDHVTTPDATFPTLSLGLRYDQKFFASRLSYFQHMDLDTSLRDTSDTLLRTRLGLRMPIANGVTVSTQLNIDYQHRPAAGKRPTDTALIFSVGYGF